VSAAPEAPRFVPPEVRQPLSIGGRREERRLLTTLFADISGFTPLAERRTPPPPATRTRAEAARGAGCAGGCRERAPAAPAP
jgi:class 3 adenylate cyclase